MANEDWSRGMKQWLNKLLKQITGIVSEGALTAMADGGRRVHFLLNLSE
jgi:hypothetical protein